MTAPVFMVEAGSFLKAFAKDGKTADYVDSIVDVWDFVWVDSEEEEARSAESILAMDVHEIVNGDYATVIDNPVIWFTSQFNAEDHEWCEDRNQHIPTLFVEVDPEQGITRKDVELATAFLGYIGPCIDEI